MAELRRLHLRRVPEVESMFFNLPNLHFLPCTPVTSKVSPRVISQCLQHTALAYASKEIKRMRQPPKHMGTA